MKENCYCLCGERKFDTIHIFNESPLGEVKLNLDHNYNRRIDKCSICGHYVSIHSYDLEKIYNMEYVDKTYGNKIYENFKKIIALPKEESDNFGRVHRILSFFNYTKKNLDVLDVGSGLCVFLYELFKASSWNCHSVDPDPRQSQHAINLGFKNTNCGFMNFDSKKLFNLITFNKVLEHVENPGEFLFKAKQHLLTDGILYIEVPDAEEAVKDTINREEFFIDHHHIFSIKSLINLIEKNELNCLEIKRFREPSGKYTLSCFAKK